MSQINFCPECGCHFAFPNPNFCSNCGLKLILSPSCYQQCPYPYECQTYVPYPMSNPQPKTKAQSKPQQKSSQPKQQGPSQQTKPILDTCTRCKKRAKSDGFSWCQQCYDDKQNSNASKPQCNSCDRRAYYDKKTGNYSDLCTQHYNEFNNNIHN